jgi:Cu/Ag efflux protein CusF
MYRTVTLVLLAGGIGVAALLAQDESIQRGTIRKIDLDKMTITLARGDQTSEYGLTKETQVLDARGDRLKERLEGLKPGTLVMFKAEERNGKLVLVGLKLAGGQPTIAKVDTSHLKPLTQLGTGKYKDFEGGLYPQGENARPAAHEAAGRKLAKQVQPLDADGKPSPKGKIVLLSIGMSNTSQSSQGFQRALDQEKEKLNPQLVFVNGAVGGMTAAATQDPNDQRTGTKYWTEVDQRLQKAGVTRAQVQAVWIKQADAGPNQGFPKYAQKLESELARIVQVLAQRFPNIKLAYLSSRTYGGYAKTPLNPEPYAFESGFSVKWLIERQIKGDPTLNFDPAKGPVKAPWLSWGPYLWANGTTKRDDGFSYDPGDFTEADGTHQSPSGMRKVGLLLFDFFENDSTTRSWFLNRSR